MSKQLRYLLHGQKAKYEDVQTSLYVTSQESTVWQKVGQQVLHRKGEAWRLLDSALVEHIPSAKRQKLGIQPLQSEQVVNLIRDLGAECVDGNLLEPSERYELLRYISGSPSYENLWRSLRLHETTNGQLESIDLGRVFLENPDFTLDERLQEFIILIRQNKQIQQTWIPQWTPREAINTVLNLPNPHEYCDLILSALNRISSQEKNQLEADLKKVSWLKGENGRGISPLEVFRLPENLVKHQEILAKLDNTKHPEIFLIESVRSSKVYEWVKKLFTYWNKETTIKKLLDYPKTPEHLQYFCTIILDALQDFNIPDSLKTTLGTESWLFIEKRTIAANQIMEIVPSKLKYCLSTVVNLSAEEYVEEAQLPPIITKHESFKTLKQFFSKWYENDIIEFILNQQEPHQHCEIILDALSSLINSRTQRAPNEINFQSLKTTAWLADEQGNAVLPENVLHYPNLEEDIEELLLTVSCSHITSSQLAKWIRDRYECWQWLTQELFITQDKALEQVGKLFKNVPEYQLGEFKEFPLDECRDVFTKINVYFLPAWTFAKKLSISKFRDLLLPNLLGKMSDDKLCSLLQSLSSSNSKPETATVEIFNAYLDLAVNYNTFSQILSKIHLLNQRGEWQTPGNLTWGKRENRDNIDSACVLNRQQTQIMHQYLESLSQDKRTVFAESELSAQTSNYSVLQTYFRPWEQHCPAELIGAFITLLMGNDVNVKNLAQLYLGRRDADAMRQRLLEGQGQSVLNRQFHEFRIHVGQLSERSRTVMSVLGTTFSAELAQCQSPKHIFVSELEPNTLDIELLPIHPERFSVLDLSLLLKKSTQAILQDIYQVDTSSVDATWGNLRQSDQLDIQVAKNFLLEGAPYIMRMLGAHDRIPAIKELLTQWDNLRHQRAELKQQKKSVEHLDNQIDHLILNLSSLLEGESTENEQIRNHLFQVVRAKIDLHGYRPQSIPFELFQNADDAAIEWMQMSPIQKLDEARTQFIVVAIENRLLFIHAGRPIGCFQHPDIPEKQYRERGFDRDLEKMLTFNISDKGESVTGKFGLGFKSVYLVCRRPQIVSKNIGFAVEGGLIPSRLNPQKATDLRKKAQKYINLSDATIVELELEECYSAQDIIQHFLELSNILLVFSRGIKKFKLINVSHPTIDLFWAATAIPGVPGVEVGKYYSTLGSNPRESALLCLRTEGDAEAALLLAITEQNGGLIGALPDNVPTFWVTAPTREILSLGLALNANFDITTGRESLVKSSDRNRDLANRIGKALGEVLCCLFNASQENWQAIAETFGITTVDDYEFWNFLWKELAVRWQKKDPSEGREIISRVLGGDRGMGCLIASCPALPSGLYGGYRQLLLMSKIRYRVTGKLSEPECFLKVTNWSRFQQTYQGQLINHTQWEEAKKLLGATFDSQRYPVTDLRLLDVLKAEIEANQLRVAPSKASEIGILITKNFLDSLNTSPELNLLQAFLQEIQFMSMAGSYLPCQQLLCDRSNHSEEMLLVGFAPNSRILHFDYKDFGLEFFYASRLKRESISIEELTQWALQAETPEKRQAVRNYLLSGERRDELAVSIYNHRTGSWIMSDASILDILNLMVQIAIKRGENIKTEEAEDFSDYNDPNFEFQTNCTHNDFSFSRSTDELTAFARMLLEGLARQHSHWKGYIYHFTHIENAASIIKSESLLARNHCPKNFCDSAGAQLIGRTGSDVKDFARFYYRPQTPTQWHNESLGKRRGSIYALCPVPIFFRLNLKRVLETHGDKCGVSSGNLAASGSHYGNSTFFLEQCFDFNNIYSTLQQVGKESFLRASQQEFIVHQCLELAKLSLEDITIICRTAQDKQTLLHLIGRNSKYASRVFWEQEIANFGSLFYHENPSVIIQNDSQFIDVQIDNYQNYVDAIQGELLVSFAQDSPLEREIRSRFSDISRIFLGKSICINASRCIQIQLKPNTQMSVYFQEKGKNWLIYTNEPPNN